MLERLDELDGYNYYFQFTINGYGAKIEPGVPDLSDVIKSFVELSNRIGKDRVIWRYDPIFINDEFTVDWHISNFETIAGELYKHTKKCVISFIDMYAKTKKNTTKFMIREPTLDEIEDICDGLSKINHRYELELATCCEKIDLERYGIKHNSCIDRSLIRRLFGILLDDKRDAQRENCGCIKCHDIGAYNTCLHKCAYCYANYNTELVDINNANNNIDSSVMIGHLESNVKVYPVKIEKGARIGKFQF